MLTLCYTFVSVVQILCIRIFRGDLLAADFRRWWRYDKSVLPMMQSWMISAWPICNRDNKGIYLSCPWIFHVLARRRFELCYGCRFFYRLFPFSSSCVIDEILAKNLNRRFGRRWCSFGDFVFLVSFDNRAFLSRFWWGFNRTYEARVYD